MRQANGRGGGRLNLGERTVACIWDHRWACMLICLLITVAAAWQATKVGTDNSLEIWFVENDPNLVSYKDFQQTFGNDEVVVVAFRRPDGILNVSGFDLLLRATTALETIEGVAGVASLANFKDITTASGSPSIQPLLPDTLLTPAKANSLRAKVLSNPLLVNQLVSRDGTTALVLVQLERSADIDARRDAILARIDKALAEIGAPYRKAGVGVIYTALNRISTVDSQVLFFATYTLIFFLLWLVYGRLIPVLVSLGVVGVATVWLMGIYGLAGRNINMVTLVLPTLILVIGVTDCIHIFMHVARTPPNKDRRQRVIEGLGFMFWPCLLTTLTTVAGFAALTTSSLPVVRDLGIFAAVGLLGCFALTLVVSTWALAWERAEPVFGEGAAMRKVAAFVAQVATRYRRVVLFIAGLLILGAGAAALRVTVDTYTIGFLSSDHPVRQDSDDIEAHFGPYTPLEFVVHSQEGVTRPEVLKAVDRWQQAATLNPSIGWSRSLVGVLKHADHLLSGDRSSGVELLNSTEQVEQLISIYRSTPNSNLHALLHEPDKLRVTFGIRMQSARGVERTMDDLLRQAQMPAGVTVRASGYLPLYVRMVDYIVSSLSNSCMVAFLVIFIIIGLLFRSARISALAVPANILPVLFTLGAMGLVGIHLDVATVTIAAVVLGLVVDDTVHFIYRLRHELRGRHNHVAAVQATIRTTGQAILTTTTVLVLGFSMLALAEIKSLVWFGLLIALAMISAVAADLLLMPALVVQFRPRLETAKKVRCRWVDSIRRVGGRLGRA